MSRAQVDGGVLRGCPVCSTPVSDVQLQLRHFAWVNEALPGHVGGMDVDFTITQHKTDRALMIEMKPVGAPISTGARLTYWLFARKGIDCWVVWGPDKDGYVTRAWMNEDTGEYVDEQTMTLDELAEDCALWWDAGLHLGKGDS